jgi:hypothetical protein
VLLIESAANSISVNVTFRGKSCQKILFFGLVLIATAMIGCGSTEIAQTEPSAPAVESPRSEEDIATETLRKMLEAATQGDWDAYVEFYGEQHKFSSPADRDGLVKRFEEKWAEKVVEGLNRAVEFPVQIDGDKAEFRDGDDTVFILYRSEDGDWTFHL